MLFALFCRTQVISGINCYSGRVDTIKNRVNGRFKVPSRFFFKTYNEYSKLKADCSDLEERGS